MLMPLIAKSIAVVTPPAVTVTGTKLTTVFDELPGPLKNSYERKRNLIGQRSDSRSPGGFGVDLLNTDEVLPGRQSLNPISAASKLKTGYGTRHCRQRISRALRRRNLRHPIAIQSRSYRISGYP